MIKGTIGTVPFAAEIKNDSDGIYFSIEFKDGRLDRNESTTWDNLFGRQCDSEAEAESDLRAFLVAIRANVDEQMRADPCTIHCSESCQLGCIEPTQGVWSSEPSCVEGKK